MTIKKTLFYFACQPKQTDTALSSKFDADTLSYRLAKAYVKNYEKHAGTVDSNVTDQAGAKVVKNPNSRAIWFSAERLEALLKKIRTEKGDGIRFYLATYDSVYIDAKKILGLQHYCYGINKRQSERQVSPGLLWWQNS
jgi:hypothetical protein